MQDGSAQLDLRKGVLGMPPRGASTGEERLQRLRGHLNDRVAFDDPRPAALELEVTRGEHAQLHYGSVCTITSAMSGRARRMRSSISLARACASASGLAAARLSVR